MKQNIIELSSSEFLDLLKNTKEQCYCNNVEEKLYIIHNYVYNYGAIIGYDNCYLNTKNIFCLDEYMVNRQQIYLVPKKSIIDKLTLLLREEKIKKLLKR